MNEFPNPAPSTTAATEAAVNALKAEVAALNRLLLLVALGGLLISGALAFQLRFQSKVVQSDLAAARQSTAEAFESDRKEKAKIQQFVRDMQAFARSHPDFTPVFSKYVPALTQYKLLEQGTPQSVEPLPAERTNK